MCIGRVTWQLPHSNVIACTGALGLQIADDLIQVENPRSRAFGANTFFVRDERLVVGKVEAMLIAKFLNQYGRGLTERFSIEIDRGGLHGSGRARRYVAREVGKFEELGGLLDVSSRKALQNRLFVKH